MCLPAVENTSRNRIIKYKTHRKNPWTNPKTQPRFPKDPFFSNPFSSRFWLSNPTAGGQRSVAQLVPSLQLDAMGRGPARPSRYTTTETCGVPWFGVMDGFLLGLVFLFVMGFFCWVILNNFVVFWWFFWRGGGYCWVFFWWKAS